MSRGFDLGGGVRFEKMEPQANALEGIKRQVELGLIPKSNFLLMRYQTQRFEERIRLKAQQAYVLPKIIQTTPVGWFEPTVIWNKEKEVRDPQLDMSMIGRLEDEADLEEFSTRMYGLTYKFGVTWREAGIARATGRSIESLTTRRAIGRMLRAANQINIEGAKGGRVTGLLNEVAGATTTSATAAFSDATNARPFEDINRAIGLVAAQDVEVPEWRVLMHPTNWAQTARIRTSSAVNDQDLLRKMSLDPETPVRFVRSTACPLGTVLGVPWTDEFADLFTTGLPQVVPVKADAEHAEWVIRMIAIERVSEALGLFKLTGV